MTGQGSVSLATLPMGPNNGTRLLTMVGTDSYDPPCMRPVASYQFALVTTPTNATYFELENNGLKTMKSTAQLTLDGAATGLYRITLFVWDDANQKSSTSSEFKLNVTQ